MKEDRSKLLSIREASDHLERQAATMSLDSMHEKKIARRCMDSLANHRFEIVCLSLLLLVCLDESAASEFPTSLSDHSLRGTPRKNFLHMRKARQSETLVRPVPFGALSLRGGSELAVGEVSIQRVGDDWDGGAGVVRYKLGNGAAANVRVSKEVVGRVTMRLIFHGMPHFFFDFARSRKAF